VRQIERYTKVLVAVSLVFAPVAGMGLVYVAAAAGLGGLFLLRAIQLRRDPTPKRAMRLFGYSISYVTALFSAMAMDQILRSL
ncbi:MAG: heme o synthase, partial [Acidimicrobiales bacterium]